MDTPEASGRQEQGKTMAKMPENDNLVMESIEDLFNQADSVSATKENVSPQLEREQSKNIPIIGARPVSFEKNAPAPENTENILVLAGQKHPLSDQAEPLFSVEKQIEDTPPPAPVESENPFLAIRQAVISAGDADGDAGPSKENKKIDNAEKLQIDSSNPAVDDKISGRTSPAKALSDRNFTDQIAHLIDNEIEVRLKAQLSIMDLANHPAKAATQGEETRKKNPPAKKTTAKRTAAGKKTQKTKTQNKSQKRAAAPAAKKAKKTSLKKTAAQKSVSGTKTRASKKIAATKKKAPAKKKS